MQKQLRQPLLLTVSALSIFVALFSIILFNTKEIGENEEAEQDGIDKAWEQEFEMTKDPTLGRIPKERLLTAWEYTKTRLMQRGAAAIPNIEWRPLGSKNYGGRTRALLVDLNDASRKTVWAGSVGGGLWKTTDITASEPNWAPVDDLFSNLAVSSLAQDPSNPQVMYFGTGEGYNNSDATRGLGVFKTTNGGITWSQLSSTNSSTYYYNFKVFVTSSGILYTCTQNGLYRSTNGGTSFTKVLGSGLGISGANSNLCYDIEEAANGDLYASLSGSVHKSTNGGTVWSSALPIGITGQRIEIALAPSNSNYVYALICNSSVVNGIVLSTDGGASFTSKSEPADADNGIPAADFSRSQAWYDLTIAVSPSEPTTVYVGGVDLFKSTTSGDSWAQLAHWYGGFGLQNVHADQHNIIFSPGSSNILYFVNDGAIYRTGDAESLVPTISYKGANYNTLQFYACAMTPGANTYNFLAGAQDNGTHKFTTSAFANTSQATGGDGAFCHIDQDEPQYWFSSYVYNNYYRSSNNGASFSSASFSSSNGRFINPTDYDDLGNKMYCAHSANNFLRWENPQTGTAFTTVSCTALAGGNVSAVKVSPNTANRVFFGTGIGGVVRVDNANAATPTAVMINTGAGMPAMYISCVEVQPGDDNHILVTYSSYGANHVWETTDGGTSWHSIQGNIPDMPVRWVIFNPNNNDQALLATELGVWTTDNINETATAWAPSNNGLANVRVDMLQTRSSDKLVIAATHGRGLYYTGAFAPATANFSSAAQIIYPGRSLQFTNTSLNSNSYSWDFGDGTFATTQNPQKKYTTAGTYNVTLSINSGASTKTQQIVVMPFSGTPYTTAQGGDFETNTTHFAAETISGTGWERGNSSVLYKNGTNSGSNAWVTGVFLSNYSNSSESYLYTPAYNLSNSGSYTFSFYTKYAFESDYDGFRVEYSIDTGKTWLPVNSVSGNWYNSPNTSGSGIFPTGEPFFSGFESSFAQKSADISFLAGSKPVAFRFAFKSDAGVTAAGAVIDDVQITGSANYSLPLDLLNFTATKADKDALLQWSTANETGVAYFDIERSWNGREFSAVGRISAQNKIRNDYNTKDFLSRVNNKPSNITYYRLKMVDKNGSFKYSNTEVLKWNDLQNSQVSVYPNPFKDHLQIGTQLNVKAVQLLDNNGKVVAATSTLNNGRFNTPALPVGTYYVRVITTDGTFTQKVMKQ